MSASSIEWTDATWNPVRGCALVSPGCEHCYAMRQAHRFSGVGAPYQGLTVLSKSHGPRWTGHARFVPEMLDAPLHWRKPRRIFVNSMSDLFHDDVTNKQIAAIFGVMAACPQHTFQVLTKRPDRMIKWFEWVTGMVGTNLSTGARVRCPVDPISSIEMCAGRLVDKLYSSPRDPRNHTTWPLPNVWLGVSAEDQQRANKRIDLLLQTHAAVHFVSAEPLLEDVTIFSLEGPIDIPDGDVSPLDWVIVGGESGPGARPCDVSWIRSIVEQCKAANVACFVKQLGAHWSRSDRKGGNMAEWPEDLRVREMPR